MSAKICNLADHQCKAWGCGHAFEHEHDESCVWMCERKTGTECKETRAQQAKGE